jgi:hypothetical protein
MFSVIFLPYFQGRIDYSSANDAFAIANRRVMNAVANNIVITNIIIFFFSSSSHDSLIACLAGMRFYAVAMSE